MTELTLENVTSKMETEGWSKYLRGLTSNGYWAKRFPSKHLCCCNEDKPGIQIIINHYAAQTINGRSIPDGFDLSLRAQKPDGAWVALTVYAIHYFEILDSQITQLISAWEVMCDNLE